MIDKNKIPKGEMYLRDKGRAMMQTYGINIKDDGQVCELHNKQIGELFVEAFSVFNDTNLTPKELLERNKELEDCLKITTNWLKKFVSFVDPYFKDAVEAGIKNNEKLLNTKT